MSQNVKLKILNFTFFDITSTILLFTSQHFSVWFIFMRKICQNWFWSNSGWNILKIIDSAYFELLHSRIGFNFQFLWRLVVCVLDFPKSVRGVTSNEKFDHNKLSKSNFKYLVKQQFLIRVERYGSVSNHNIFLVNNIKSLIGRNIPKIYLLTNKEIR